MRQWKWLHNVDEPDANPVYEVRNIPRRIRVYGLNVGDIVEIDVLVGPSPAGTAGVDYEWVPLVRCSAPVVMTSEHNHFMEFIPGYYRVRLDQVANPDQVRITVHDDEASTDAKGLVLVEGGETCCTYTWQNPVAPIPPGPGGGGPGEVPL